MSSNNNNSRQKIVKLSLILLIAIGVLLSLSEIDQKFAFWHEQNWQDVKELIVKGIGIVKEREKLVKREEIKIINEESAVIDIVEKASPSVVSVLERSLKFNFFTGPQLREASIGTGFAVESDLVVSNKHVVSDQSANYSVVDNEGSRFEIKQIYRDPLNDLALLRIEGGNFTPLELGDSDQVKVGQTVVAIGNALGRFSNTVTKGVISGKGRGIIASAGLGQFQEELENVLQTDAALNPGNSGGPLLDLAGQVIGVNVAIGLGSENIGFAIPGNTVQDLISDFNVGVEREKPFLGIYYVLITKELARNSDFPEGVLIREIVSGTAASKGDLQVNDVITEMNGEPINEDNLLAKVILDYNVGDEIEIKIWRNGDEKTFSLVLEAASES